MIWYLFTCDLSLSGSYRIPFHMQLSFGGSYSYLSIESDFHINFILSDIVYDVFDVTDYWK